MSHLRAYDLLTQRGFDPRSVAGILSLLADGGFLLADRTEGEFVCRWVNVLDRAVPPDADTVIRTLTLTSGDRSSSNTHWLEGIQPPPPPPNP